MNRGLQAVWPAIAGVFLSLGLLLAACAPPDAGEDGLAVQQDTGEAVETASAPGVLDTSTCAGCGEGVVKPVFVWASGEPGPQQTNFVRVAQAQNGTRLIGRGGGASSGGHTSGAFFTIAGEAEALASGQSVRIEVELRGSQGQVLPVAYSTADVGNSGWQEFTLSGAREWVSFDYAVNPMREGNNDYLGILPAEGEDVLLYRVRVLRNTG